MEQLENSFSLCSFPRQIPKHFCLFGGFTYFLSHQWLSATPTRVALWGKHFSFTKKIYIFPCGGWHLSCDSLSGCLYPYLHITPSLSQDTVLRDPRPHPGWPPAASRARAWPCTVPPFIFPCAPARKSEWNTAEQINIHCEGMWGICNHTAWMLGSSMCDRRGKSKWKAHASEGQQPGPFD